MTSQVKNTIAQLLTAGFKRKQFSVRVERIYCAQYRKDGCSNPYDYGKAIVIVGSEFRGGEYWDSSRVIEERVEAVLATGLGVVKGIWQNGLVTYTIDTSYERRGKLAIVDLREDKNTVPLLYGGHKPREIAQGA